MPKSLNFSSLSQWQQIAYSATLLERMLPNYKLFSEATDFGQYSILRNQLDTIWQWLDKNNRCKINYEAQLAKLEPQIPEPDTFDFFGVYPALDTCMAMVSLFQIMQDKTSDGCENVSKLSKNSVANYVELMLNEEHNENLLTSELIDNHPLMQWEIETQQELFNYIEIAQENKKSCIHAKSLVLEEGLSNLGIEV